MTTFALVGAGPGLGLATARDFAARLPLTLTLRDFNQAEKIADLPHRLPTSGAPAGADPRVGDRVYYAPWGTLASYYRDARPMATTITAAAATVLTLLVLIPLSTSPVAAVILAFLMALTGFRVNPVVTSLAVRFAGDAPPSPRH